MTGIARDDDGLGNGRLTEHLYTVLSRLLAVGLVVGPIVFGIWFASSAIEDVKPLDPLPPPKIAPLPKLPNESEAMPSSGAVATRVNLAGPLIDRIVH
jgi:hypothetical protein